MSDTEGSVWIRTVPTKPGSYGIVLDLDDDHAQHLTPNQAHAHALAVLRSVQITEHDAKVYGQLAALTDTATAAGLVLALREDRAPLSDRDQSTLPFHLEPGITIQGKPFLRFLVAGKAIGQWSLDQAREHAIGVLEAVVAAQLDTAYHRALVDSVGLDAPAAERAVDALAAVEVPTA